MIYTYQEASPNNELLGNLLSDTLGAEKLSQTILLLSLTEDDVVVFINIDNNPEFDTFIGLVRTVLTCRSIKVTGGLNNCESIIRDHYNITIDLNTALQDLPKLVESYRDYNLPELTNWRARWR